MKKTLLLAALGLFIACGGDSDNDGDGNNGGVDPTYALSSSLSTIDYGEQVVDLSQSKSITLSNTGNQDLRFDNINVPVGFVLSETSFTIEAGSNKTLNLSFSPTEVKTYNATLEIEHNNIDKISIELDGQAVGSFYNSNIKPVINQNCNVSGCHNSTMRGGIGMRNYLENVAAFKNDDAMIAINGGNAIISSMPKGGYSLTQQEKEDFQTWVNANYLN